MRDQSKRVNGRKKEQSVGSGTSPLAGTDRFGREDVQHPCAKKIWHQTVELLRRKYLWISIGLLCGLFGYSRQSYYRWDNTDFADNAIEPLIVEEVQKYRKDNPGLGCAKLYLIIKKLSEETGSMPGRDAFIELLRRNGLMVRLKRRRHYRTTDSNHHYRYIQSLNAVTFYWLLNFVLSSVMLFGHVRTGSSSWRCGSRCR